MLPLNTNKIYVFKSLLIFKYVKKNTLSLIYCLKGLAECRLHGAEAAPVPPAHHLQVGRDQERGGGGGQDHGQGQDRQPSL